MTAPKKKHTGKPVCFFERVKKGCHCEEPLGDVAIRIPKMFPFWLQCVQNRKVLGNGLPRGCAPRNDSSFQIEVF